MLQVWLLGQFEIKLDGRRVVLSARAAQSLLAYLMLSAGTPHRREKLAGLFWSDLPEENARRNLRQELWRLRKALASPTAGTSEYLLAEELTLTFNRDAEYWLDAAQLQKSETDLDSLISALSLYRGELLPGMYDDWISLERERLQAVFENKMQTLLEQLIDAKRWNTIVEWGERWIAQGQTPEPAYRALMVAHNALGNAAQVALDYQRCTEALRNEVGVEPSGDTRVLFETLTRGESAEARIATPLPTIFVQSAGTITFLFSDIEGSTKLLEQLGNEYANLLADQRDVLRAAAETYNGHEVDTQGDSFFFAFFRAADAVNFAAASQRALSAHKWSNDVKLRVRMGLHTGEPMLARTGYVGMDVHRAARIGASGHGGQVLLSQTTSALVENQLPEGTALTDLGEHKLKDLRYPVHIIQLSIEGLPSDFPPLKAISTGIEPPAPGEPPFKGLEFFDERDADLFFGREQLTAKLVQGLRDSKFLAVVVGASGSGKSSVVRAGVVPALKKGAPLQDGTLAPADSALWITYILTPSAHPLEALATALTRDSESVTATATLVDDLTKDPRALHLFLRRRTEDERRKDDLSHSSSVLRHVLLVVDQFEELFTLCRDEYEREAFIDNLLTALSYGDAGNLTVMLTIRADFYAHLAQYPELRDAVAKHQEFIGPMTGEELRRAMQEPAARAGWEFEPGLVDLILRDVGDEPGALPLLSHALLETWKRRSGHTLTLKGYHDAGGVRGAIAQTAETTYQQLPPDQQTIARNIFLRLTELGQGTEDTRRRASFAELIPHDETAASVYDVLRQLADARLVTLHADTAEVAHEALIREWPQLREWLNQDREGLHLHRQITEAAQEWEMLEHDTGALYRGTRLLQAHEWVITNPYTLNADERAFLEASAEQEKKEAEAKQAQQRHELEQAQKLAETETRRATEQRRSAGRLRWFAAGLALFLLLALGAAWFAFNKSVDAQNNFVIAERIRIASQAQIALDNGEGGDVPALLSLESLKHGYSPEADASLLNSLKRGFTKQIFTGHTDLLWIALFSPDGTRIVTSSNDGTTRLWDVATGEELKRFEPGARILDTASFSPDGRYVITGGPGDVARLWDTETGAETKQFKGIVGGVWSTAYSSDGKFVIISDDKMARMFDVQTGQEIQQYIGHTGQVTPALLSHNNSMIASASPHDSARVWDTKTGRELQKIPMNTDIIWVDFSGDDKSIFTASDNTVRQWDITTGQEIQRFVGHTATVIWGAISPDGKYLATASADKTARVWDISSGQEVRQFIGHTAAVFSVAISPDGKSLLTGSEDRTARIWDLDPSVEPQLVSTKSQGNITTASSVPAVLSQDSGHLFYGYDREVSHLAIWNTQIRELHYQKLEGVTNYSSLSAFASSLDNHYLLGGDSLGTLWKWDMQTGKQLQKLDAHSAPIRSVAYSNDGRFLLSGGDDKTAMVWDAQTGTRVAQLIGHSESISVVGFSEDSKSIITASADKTARLWETQTGKQIQQFIGHAGPIRAVALSSDGKFIVTGSDDQTARLWDISTGKEVRQFIGHTGQVSHLTFSPDGQFVLTGSADQTARLWNVQTGALVREFVGHVSPVLYLAFADNGRTIITGDTQYAYRWRASLDDVISFACSQLTRDLITDERTLYRITDSTPACAKFTPATKTLAK